MLGAIIGDIVGSRFEFHNTKKYDFGELFNNYCSFTDDTICTVAIADALLHEGGEIRLVKFGLERFAPGRFDFYCHHPNIRIF